MSYYQEWRLLIGPHYSHINGPDWGWWMLDYGSNEEFASQTTLRLAMTKTSSTVALEAGGLFAAQGGIWLGGRDGQAYEYIRYQSKSNQNVLATLTREPIGYSSHDSTHPVGDLAYNWFPVATDDGRYQLNWTSDENLASTTWELSIQGVLFQHWLLRNGHVAVVQVRNDPWSLWRIELLGVIDSPASADDSKHEATWSVKIKPMISVWANQPVKGIRVGDIDVAKRSSATGTTALVMPFDERDTDDYYAADPDLSAGGLVDDDPQSMWLAERFIGTNPPAPGGGFLYRYPTPDPKNSGEVQFGQIYVNPPPGTPQRNRWIELILVDGEWTHYQLYAANGGTGAFEWITDLNDSSVPDDGGSIILCEDMAVFQEMNPLADPGTIKQNAALFVHLLPAGGEIRLRHMVPDTWTSRVQWGNGNGEVVHENLTPSDYGDPIAPGGIPSGATLDYLHGLEGGTDAASYWRVGKIKHAGYKITNSDEEWVQIDLPPLGLKLLDDMGGESSGEGGAETAVAIVNEAGRPDISGIALSGTIQIGDEQIVYGFGNRTLGTIAPITRGANGTTMRPHAAGDRIRVVNGGVVSDAHLIKEIGWKRTWPGTVPAQPITPRAFTVYTSTLDTVRNPGTEGWESDWASVYTATTYNLTEWSLSIPNGARIRHWLVEISMMNVDPARPRLNEVSSILHTSVYDPSLQLPAGTTSFQFIRKMFTNGGFPIFGIVGVAGTFVLADVVTEDADALWPAVVNFADYAGLRVVVQPDSKIAINQDPFWTGSVSSSAIQWNQESSGDASRSASNGAGISQYKMPWRNHANTLSGEVVYPTTPDPIGAVVELPEHLLSGTTTALTSVRRRYQLARYPYTEQYGGIDGYPTMRPRELHLSDWTYNEADGPIGRVLIATQIDNYVEEGHLWTVAHLRQIEREVDW